MIPAFRRLLPALFLLFLGSVAFSQKTTIVKGKITDADTREPLSFVNVSYNGTSVGTTSDLDGKYLLETLFPSDTLVVSFIGYETQKFPIIKEKKQSVDFELKMEAMDLSTVTIKAKKKKYRKKGNPAVDLMRKAIAKRKDNRLESNDYYEYEKYEKIEFDLNNITDKFRNRKVFNKFEFIFELVDTSDLNGKPYLPIFIKETASRVYYRKDPKSTKEYRDGIKLSGLDKYIDDASMSDAMDLLYQDFNIYDNSIMLLDYPFVSPFSNIALDFYKFFIIDTVQVNGIECVELAVATRNKQNLGFLGHLFITTDSSYALVKADLGMNSKINLNYVRDIKLEVEYSPFEDSWVLTKNQIVLDYALTKNALGLFGSRSVSYRNFVFNQPRGEDIYKHPNDLIDNKKLYKQDSLFWVNSRHEELSEKEKGIYHMIDTLQKVPAFKNALEILSLLITGYKEVGPIDIGPIYSFYRFNSVEGFRLRLGGETNFNFSKKLQLQGYGAYGFKSKEFKYSAAIMYSFNEDFRENPRKHIRAELQRETEFPGAEFTFVNDGNILLSIRRGSTDKMISFDNYKLEFFHETLSDFAYAIQFNHRKRRPDGNLLFPVMEDDGLVFLPTINTSEFGLDLRWAPNQRYFQGRQWRYAFESKYPVFDIKYRAGVENLFGGEYSYHKLYLKIFKRFDLSVLGSTKLDLEASKIWGKNLPFVLLNIPRANQSYAYFDHSYNMMNFLEFYSDQFVSLNFRHYFNGFFMNKIPLIKLLKWREIITFKIIYGSVSPENDPNLNDSIVQLPTDADGNPTTFSLAEMPYMEGSVGFSNIFKLFQVDLVKRFNYLDHPEVPKLWGVDGLGIRAKFKLEF